MRETRESKDLLKRLRIVVGCCRLVVCDKLSASLVECGSDDKLHAINLIEQLLMYAKMQFLRAPNASGGVSLCDTILSHVELLQSLTISKCPVGKISLMDFSDTQKAR